MTDYLKVYNENHDIAVSQLQKSWYLKRTENIKEYLQEYSINVSGETFTTSTGTENMPSTFYRGIIPDEDNSIIVLSNPSDTPVYLCVGYGIADIVDHYDKGIPGYIYKHLGRGLCCLLACDNKSVIENIKVLTFEPTQEREETFGLQIFNEKSEMLFSAASYPLKIIAHRRTNYSKEPRYFYRGSDDVQEAVYNKNNYFTYYGNKTIGFFSDILTGTRIYSGHSYSHNAYAVAAKLSKNYICTGVYEARGNMRHTKHYYMDGTESSFTYWNGFSEPRMNFVYGDTCEQSSFSVFDVTNYY